jgi:hypothetical protein
MTYGGLMNTSARPSRGRLRIVSYFCSIVALLALFAGPAAAAERSNPIPPASPGDVLDDGAKPVLDWSVPGRFDASWAAWNPLTSTYNPDFVNPRSWSISLDGCASRSVRRITGYTFTLTQLGGAWTRTSSGPACLVRYHDMLPAQGYYRATLTLHTDWGGGGGGVSLAVSRIVQIRDYLIVSMGDSLASGEGNPDVPGKYNVDTSFFTDEADHATAIRAVKWQDQRCHRSAKSGPALAAKAFETRYASVTFLSFACSGAMIQDLISRPYGGIERVGTSTVPPQVDAVRAAVGPGSPRGGRPVDALLVSAGVNNLYFSSIVKRCAKNLNIGDHLDCVNGHGIAANAAALPSLYKKLAYAIKDKLPNAREVYLNDYPSDVFRGGACGTLGHSGFGIDDAEASEINLWGGHLDQAITDAAVRYRDDTFRWNLVGDLAVPFESHAYCDRDSWFTSYEQSWRTQGNVDGTAHPNAEGDIEYGKLLHRAIALDQASQPLRSLTITIKAIKLNGTGGNNIPIEISLAQDQNGDFSQDRYIEVPRNGQWTPVPAALGVFTLNVFPSPSSPRHALDLQMEVDHVLPIHHTFSDGYGAGDHILDHPAGILSVSYSVAVRNPQTSPVNAGLRKG